MHKSIPASAILVLATLCGPAKADNWAQWRGPAFNGSSAETNLPAKIGPNQGVVWRAKLPGGGGSTPIVWGDRIFLTAQDRSQRLSALCISRDGGKVLWRHAVGMGFGNRHGNTGASPSPITDGKTVWFLFGTGELLACDMAGKQLWRRNIQKDHGKFEILWDYGASALLLDGRLYVPVIHGNLRTPAQARGKSYLLCIDPKTGRDIWKHSRQTKAPFEAKQAYTTPIPHAAAGGTQILLTGADCVTAHDPKTGGELWRSASYNPRKNRTYRTVVSPAVCDNMVIVAAPRGGDLYGGAIGSYRWACTHKGNSPDVPTPLSFKGRFFVLHGMARTLLCIEPKSGRILSRCKLDAKGVFQASPTGADGKIYCITLTGELFVLSAEDPPKVLHRASFKTKDVRSTVSISNGQLFVRADDTLYCFGRQTK